MKFLVALLVSLVLIVTPFQVTFAGPAPAFPFATYQSVPVEGSQQACENGGVVVYVRGNEWRVLSWQSRDLFVHYDKDGNADWVYMTVDGGNGKIKVVRILPAAEAIRLFPSGCEYGDLKDV